MALLALSGIGYL